MTRHVFFAVAAIVVSAAAVGASPAYAQSSTGQITVLYDAFGKTSTMKKDWGFSALAEGGFVEARTWRSSSAGRMVSTSGCLQ